MVLFFNEFLAETSGSRASHAFKERSRIMGYLRSVTMDGHETYNWNKGKVSEWKERTFFDSEEKMA